MPNNDKRATTRTSALKRKRTIKAALQYLSENLPGRFPGRAAVIREIKASPRPVMAAKRLTREYRTQDVTSALVTRAGPDFSDVQEIRAKLIKRDHILDQPQAMALARMDRMIASGEMTEATFKNMASEIIGMKPSLPLDVRKAEAAFRRGEEISLEEPPEREPEDFSGPADMRSVFPHAARSDDPRWNIPVFLRRTPKEAAECLS